MFGWSIVSWQRLLYEYKVRLFGESYEHGFRNSWRIGMLVDSFDWSIAFVLGVVTPVAVFSLEHWQDQIFFFQSTVWNLRRSMTRMSEFAIKFLLCLLFFLSMPIYEDSWKIYIDGILVGSTWSRLENPQFCKCRSVYDDSHHFTLLTPVRSGICSFREFPRTFITQLNCTRWLILGIVRKLK